MSRQLGFFVYAVVLIMLLWGFVNLLPKEADKPSVADVVAPTTSSSCDRITEASRHWKAQVVLHPEYNALELTKSECRLHDMGVR